MDFTWVGGETQCRVEPQSLAPGLDFKLEQLTA